jgi:prepilin-type N-terminal cleavage/methylation domain-containing protein
MRKERSGFSLIEMLVVICIVSICMAIVAPKFRVSTVQRVNLAADLLVNDLEQVRTRAITARGATRVVITTATNSYTAYLDDNGDGVINEVATETVALRGLQTRILTDNVIFGRGAAPQLAGFPGAGATTFTGNAVDFDTRGVTTPFGARGVVYFTSLLDNTAVAAVTVTPGGGIRRWVYRGGAWQ